MHSVSEDRRAWREGEENSGVYRDEPEAVSIDPGNEQRELEAAGWERLERQGKIVWQNPHSGHLYPQGAAIALLRGGVPDSSGEAEGEPRGS